MGEAETGRIPLAKGRKPLQGLGISQQPRFEPLLQILRFLRRLEILAQGRIFRKHSRAEILSRQGKRFRRQPIDPGQQAVQHFVHFGYKINPMRGQEIHRRKADAIGFLMMAPGIVLDTVCAFRPFRTPGFPIKSPPGREDAFRANTVFSPQQPLNFFFIKCKRLLPRATFPPDSTPSSRTGRWIPPRKFP